MDRRTLLMALGLAPALVLERAGEANAQGGIAASVADVPDVTTFQTGDFVWPKQKGATVVRGARPIASSAPSSQQEQREWEIERDRIVALQLEQSGLSPEAQKRLGAMTYQQALDLYFSSDGTVGSGAVTTRGAAPLPAGLSVGHVGIIEIDAQGVAQVIEATTVGRWALAGQGAVIRSPYQGDQGWLAQHKDQQVWHGRIWDIDAVSRRSIAAEAAKQLGKPYNFFNFDLSDESGFYCSKLAWLAILRATGKPVDGDTDPRRGSRLPPWFSPKALLNTPRMSLLHTPGKY